MEGELRITFIIILFFSGPLSAQPVITADTDRAVGESVAYYADPSGQLSINQVASDSVANEFVLSDVLVPNFGLSSATYWLRLRIKNTDSAGQRRLLELAYPLLDSVFFYQLNSDGQWQETIDGELVKNQSAIFYKHFLFPLNASDTAVQTYYFRIKTESAARFPIYLHRADRFFATVVIEEIIFGVFYGAMLVMVIYNLFLFFTLRDQSYLLYCAFIFLNTCAQATFNGHIQQLGFALPFANTWLLLTMFGAALCGIIFAITFLKIKQFSRRLYRVLQVGAVVASLFLPLSWVLPYQISAVVAAILFLIVPVVVWISGWVAWWSGNVSARYFIIAWTLYLVAVTLISLRTLGLIDGSMPLEAAMQIGSVLDAVLLSMALADRITVYRRERAQAQERTLATLREKEQLVKEQNQRLEKKVQERTEEISAQNEELQVQQETIAGLNEQLTEQNQDLEEEVDRRTQELARSNQRLVGQNQRLEQFASVISHNLRGPVANILGLNNVLDRESLTTFNQKCLDHLQKATQRLDMILNDLNELLTYRSGKPVDIEPVYLKRALEAVVEKLAPTLVRERAEILIDLRDSTHVPAVASYVESIFDHIIDNAIKFRSPNRALVVRITARRTAHQVVVEISDNGLGIDAKRYEQKLFSLYQRFHTHREGRGVGLYLVKTQMEALGGSISVKSSVGEGTTFCLYFDATYPVEK